MVPKLGFVMEFPTSMFSRDASGRLHNRLMKSIMGTELYHHWRTRIPGHFLQAAHSKYRHTPRDPAYVRAKLRRFGINTDLVRSSRTKLAMTGRMPRTRIGGNATDGTLSGQMFLEFPFRGGKTGRTRKAGRAGVTVEDMKREIATWTPEEAAQVAKSMAKNYATLYSVEASQKQRKTI